MPCSAWLALLLVIARTPVADLGDTIYVYVGLPILALCSMAAAHHWLNPPQDTKPKTWAARASSASPGSCRPSEDVGDSLRIPH